MKSSARRRPPRPGGGLIQFVVGLVVGIALLYALGLLLYIVGRDIAPRLAGIVPGFTTLVNWLTLAATFEPFLLLPWLPLLVLALVARSRLATGALGLVALPFVLFYAPFFLPRTPPPPAAHSVRVLTSNILAVNRETSDLTQTILEQDADIVALQELLPGLATQFGPRLAAAYPYRVLHSREGLGLYSRYPLRNAELLTLAPERSYAQRVIADTPVGPVTVYNAHPRNPEITWGDAPGPLRYIAEFDPARRDRAVVALAQALDQTTGPVIVLGDLNTTDRSPVYRLLTARLKDAHREAGWGLGYTFPDSLRLGRVRVSLPVLRIDYVLHSPDLRVLTVETFRMPGSDHRAVVATLGK